MTENIIVSSGSAAANGYAYMNNNIIINPKNTTHNKIHQVTYDYAFNSLYITFNKENLNISIGEILVNENDKWNLPCINTQEKKVLFTLILNAILEEVKYLRHDNIPEETNKLKQIINLIN